MDINHKIFFDEMPVPRFLVRMTEDKKYHVVEANQRAIEYFHRRREQIVNCDMESFIDNENVRHFEQAFQVCLRQKMPVTIQALPSLPGSVRVYGFWINPVVMDDGETVLMDVMAQPDTTDESILQRERDDAISLLTSIFDVSEIGIFVTDRHRRVVRVNDSFLRAYGWKREDIVGEDFAMLLPAGEKKEEIQRYDAMMDTGIRSSGEGRIMRKDGSIANVLYTTATLDLSQGRTFQVKTMMDITLRKQMEISLRMAKERADAANNAKSSFLANMSHELRTPLNAVIGFSEIMMNETFGALGSEKYIEYLGDIHLSAKHLLEIINEVLDMSKIESGKVDLDEQEIDIKGLVTSVVRIMESRAFKSQVKLTMDIEEKSLNVIADMRLIRQVLINLVSNAIKFSKKDQEIKVSVYQDDTEDLIISVKDDGIGIPKDKIKEALEPFGQIMDSQHAKEQQGTGLGLPLARAMVELHGGQLELDSDVGKGTLVTMSLPSRRVIKPKETKE